MRELTLRELNRTLLARQALHIEPFEPLPARVRRELDAERARLVAFSAS